VIEDKSEEIVTSEQWKNEEQEVILRDNKKVLCEKPQFDIENNMGKDCCEKVVEGEVFVHSSKEKEKNEKTTFFQVFMAVIYMETTFMVESGLQKHAEKNVFFNMFSSCASVIKEDKERLKMKIKEMSIENTSIMQKKL
jgi:hypothetical protein